MRFNFLVEVEVSRTEGKFASRDEIAQQIQDALEQADPGNYDSDNGGQYETAEWAVSEAPEKKPARKIPAAYVPGDSIVKGYLKELESLRAFKRTVDEALNSGDGSYRP